MKNLFKTVLFAAVGAAVFVSCNKKDDYDYVGEALKMDNYYDSLLNIERDNIKDYVDTHYGNTAQEDSLLFPFQVLDKKVKRGYWHVVITTPTEEDEEAYEYKFNSAGYVMLPKVKLKYTTKLLNGTIVEKDVEGSEYDLNQTFAVRTQAWLHSFVPNSIKYNGENKLIGGLTKNGLKKGSEIHVVAPSMWSYGPVTKEADGKTTLAKIPANSPLVYEFEVLSIQ